MHCEPPGPLRSDGRWSGRSWCDGASRDGDVAGYVHLFESQSTSLPWPPVELLCQRGNGRRLRAQRKWSTVDTVNKPVRPDGGCHGRHSRCVYLMDKFNDSVLATLPYLLILGSFLRSLYTCLSPL